MAADIDAVVGLIDGDRPQRHPLSCWDAPLGAAASGLALRGKHDAAVEF